MSRLGWAIGLAAAVASVATSAHAGLPDGYGLGSRSAAMAGAVGADARDFSTVAYNPAGAVEAPELSLSAGYSANFQALLVEDRDSGVADVRGLVGGLVAPGRLFGVPIAFAVALHLPDDGLSFIRARRQEAPRWELYDARQQLLFFAATLAVRPLPWLELGGGLGFLSATRGRFGIRGTAELAAPFDSQLEHEVDADLTAVRYPLLGVRVVKPRWGAVGLSYRGSSQLDLALGARLDGTVALGGIAVPLLYQLEAHTLSSFTPAALTASWSFQRVPGVHVNVDVSWTHWSGYASPTARIAALLDVEPPPGLPVTIPAPPAPTLPLPPHFRDTIVPRLGVEWQLPLSRRRVDVHGAREPAFALPVRAGYAYEASPVPEQRGVTSFLDADRHTFSAGVGVAAHRPFEALPGSLKLDVHGSLGVLPERTTTKSSPSDFTGDLRMSGRIVGVGACVEVAF